MKHRYIHGYNQEESLRLQDQASTLVELLHADTFTQKGAIFWKPAVVLEHKR